MSVQLHQNYYTVPLISAVLSSIGSCGVES